jgi:hypothetical protein
MKKRIKKTLTTISTIFIISSICATIAYPKMVVEAHHGKNNSKESHHDEKNEGDLSATKSEKSTGTVTDSSLFTDCDNLIFSAQYYITKYPDLATAIGYNSHDLYNHFIQYGIAEGRQGIETFDVQTYCDNNPDLVAAFGDDLMSYCNHYIQTGHSEGRICH